MHRRFIKHLIAISVTTTLMIAFTLDVFACSIDRVLAVQDYMVIDMLDTPDVIKAKGKTGAIKLVWTPVDEATGYIIAYGDADTGTVDKIINIEDPVACKKTIKIKKNKSICIKILAYSMNANGDITGVSSFSNAAFAEVK